MAPPHAAPTRRLPRALAAAAVVLAAVGFLAIDDPMFAASRPLIEAARSLGDSSARPRHTLRFDWTDMPPQTDLGRKIAASQTPRNCDDLSGVKFKSHRVHSFGLGSSLHIYSQALCHAVDHGMVMINERDPEIKRWVWNDKEACRHVSGPSAASPLQCYFGPHESASFCDNLDPSDLDFAARSVDHRTDLGACGAWPDYPLAGAVHSTDANPNLAELKEFRAASMEFLFSSVRPVVVREAERQVGEAFGDGGIPDDLITVHVRWGDKETEMRLIPIEEYIRATEELAGRRRGFNSTEPVHVYLATEDPRALEEFRKNCPPEWKMYTSGPTNLPEETSMMKNARRTKGRAGLESLGALLIALEANRYVLTGESNWSRLIDELRKNLVNPRCGGCTEVIDLAPSEF